MNHELGIKAFWERLQQDSCGWFDESTDSIDAHWLEIDEAIEAYLIASGKQNQLDAMEAALRTASMLTAGGAKTVIDQALKKYEESK